MLFFSAILEDIAVLMWPYQDSFVECILANRENIRVNYRNSGVKVALSSPSFGSPLRLCVTLSFSNHQIYYRQRSVGNQVLVDNY